MDEKGRGGSDVSASTTAARGCGGDKREGGRVPRSGEVEDPKWGSPSRRGMRRGEPAERGTFLVVA